MPASKEIVNGLLTKDVEMATLRAALKKALSDARRTLRLQRSSSISSMNGAKLHHAKLLSSDPVVAIHRLDIISSDEITRSSCAAALH